MLSQHLLPEEVCSCQIVSSWLLCALVFSSVSLCRVAFISDIYKTDEAPGTKQEGAERGKVLSKCPAKNVPGVFCCEGKAMGVTRGLEMFRAAIC